MIVGSGGSGADSPRTPVESPDSLVNISYAKILDLVSEGEIVGLKNGAESIFLNGTQAMSNGVYNFSGFSFEQRFGTQNQEFMSGFPQIESNISVGVELRNDIPYIRTITNNDITALRINIQLPRFARQITSGKLQGDTVGYAVVYAIDIDDGSGIFAQISTGRFDGKTVSGYQRSIRVDLPRTAGSRRVRVRRITPNATSSNIADTTNIASITEIIDAKFTYPNSAYFGVRFDAQNFGGQIPSRAYLLRGRIISVPKNYDTVTRTYSGVWDGSFKKAYTNNPAWVFYDLILHPRYGLGDRIDSSQIDKWSLYDISRYCDQMIDDGKGGLEPRYTCNCYLQSQGDALRVLQDLASVFRGITYWGAGQAYVSADMPKDAKFTYTNANVIDGKFSYKGSRRNTRYSVAIVGWNDPDNQYKIKTEYVEDRDAINRYGYQSTSVTAFGCTSQGQAIRLGKQLLLTNMLEAEMVTFAAGLESVRVRPGEVIRINDNFRAGRRIGGRILSATLNSITCDKIESVMIGDSVFISMPDGTSAERSVSSVSGNTINFTEPLPELPVRMAVFAIESDEIASQFFRVLSISDNGDNTYSFSCSKYVADKYDYIDSGVIISQKPISILPLNVQQAPQNVSVTSDYLIDQYQAVTTMTIKWDKAEGAVKYAVEWRRDNNNWVYAGDTYNTEIDVAGIYTGIYDVRVKAISSTNKHSVWTSVYGTQLDGKNENTAVVQNLSTVSRIMAVDANWDFPASATDTAYTELRYSFVSSGENPTSILISYPTNQYTHGGMAAAVQIFFSARLIDKSGNFGPWSSWVMGISNQSASEILDYLTGQITDSELSEELYEQIQLIPEIEDQIAILESQIAEITGAPEWDPSEIYLEGTLVKDNGSLYRAIQDVPAGTPTTDAAYWEKIGDYDSLGEAVSALYVRMSAAETSISNIDGRVTANANEITIINSELLSQDGRISGNAEAIELLESEVSEIEGVVTVQARSMSQLTASYRDLNNDEGLLENVLATHQNQASILEVRRVLIDSNSAQAEINLTLTASLNENRAAIQNEQLVRSNETSALAQQINTVQAQTGNNTSSIQLVNSAITTLEGDVSATYAVKLQTNVNGVQYVAGIGLGLTNETGTTQSQFIVIADRFAILNNIDGSPVSPFIVSGGQTIINNALIGDATINFAKISDTLQSTDYVANTTGWRWGKDGTIEINGSQSGQGRLSITNQKVAVYDTNGIARVELGLGL